MSQVDELCNKIKKWKEIQSKKIVNDLIMSVQKLTNNQPQSEINTLLDIVTAFHKEINKSSKQLIDQSWFPQVQKAKKHLKKIQEDRKKQKTKPLQLIKSNSNIEVPEQLTQNKKQQQKSFARILYKSFLLNLPENILERKKDIVQFIDKVIYGIYDIFGIDKQKRWMSEDKSRSVMIRVEKIAQHFKKRQSNKAKQDMIDGIISYKGVSQLQADSFISEKTRIAEQKRLQAMVRQNQTGFYDQMKKDINKNASEQCRFCRKQSAYCEGQKQIRAADEPMTRFMVCNSCGKRWRQQ